MVQLADKLRRWRGGLTGDAARRGEPRREAACPRSRGRRGQRGAGVPDVGFSLDFQVEGGGTGATRRGRGRGGARLDRGAGPGAARGRRLGAAADGPGSRSTASAWRICSPRAQADGTVANHALPELAALCDALEQPPPPGLERLAPLVEGFEKLPDARAARGSHRDAARLPAAGRQLARASCATRGSAACSPTTWASGRRCRRCARWARHAGGRARPACSPTGRRS